MALTQAQIKQYYAEEGNKPNPLSPTAWLASKTAAPATPAVATTPVVTQTQTPVKTTSNTPTLTQEQILNYQRMGVPIPGQTATPTTPAMAGGTDQSALLQQIASIQAQIAQKQKEYKAEVAKESIVKSAASVGLDYPAQALTGSYQLSSDERQAIYDKYGVSNLEATAFQAPEKTYSQIYQQALLDLGVTAKQEAYNSAVAELDALTQSYNEAVDKNNRNPWFSQANLSGINRVAQEAYTKEASRLQAKVTLAANNLESAKSDAQDLASRTYSELEANQQLDQKRLAYLAQKAEAEIAAQTEINRTEAEGEAYRYLSQYAQSVPQDSGLKTQVYDVGGMKILYTYDAQGNVTNKQVLGASGSGGTAMEQQAQSAQVNSLQTTIQTIDTLLGDDAISQVVNKDWKTKLLPLAWERMSFDAKNYIASVEQLISQNTLDTLINAKARGATFGALSDKETQMLRSAASKIGTWTMRDDNQNVLGYSIDANSFKTELNTLKTLANKALSAIQGDGTASSSGITSAEQSYVDSLGIKFNQYGLGFSTAY